MSESSHQQQFVYTGLIINYNFLLKSYFCLTWCSQQHISIQRDIWPHIHIRFFIFNMWELTVVVNNNTCLLYLNINQYNICKTFIIFRFIFKHFWGKCKTMIMVFSCLKCDCSHFSFQIRLYVWFLMRSPWPQYLLDIPLSVPRAIMSINASSN